MRFLTLFGLLLSPFVNSAQSQTLAPIPSALPASRISIEPATQALLQRATNVTKTVRSLHFQVSTELIQNSSLSVIKGNVDFQQPNRLRSDFSQDTSKYRVISNGIAVYRIEGSSSQLQPTAAKIPTRAEIMGLALTSRASVYLSGMLGGVSPLDTIQEKFGQLPQGDLILKATTVPDRAAGGEILAGVRLNYSYMHPQYGKRQIEDTLWFGPDGLLAQAQTNLWVKGKKFVEINETLNNFKINPTFSSGTFQFEAPKKVEEPSTFDSRLKVGASPFPFAAKSLTGQVISPAKFKGKVLLLDFWATWCGPCVASLPELQATYKKYHAQGLEVVSISLDDDRAALEKFVKARKLPWPQLFDGKGWKNAVAARYGVQAIPFMLVIGKDGKIVALDPEGHLDATVKSALSAQKADS